jgi:hypothetical protein
MLTEESYNKGLDAFNRLADANAWEDELPRTLYNRLKEESRIKLEATITSYPTVLARVKKAFEQEYFVHELKFDILQHCRTFLNWDLNDVYKHFEDK